MVKPYGPGAETPDEAFSLPSVFLQGWIRESYFLPMVCGRTKHSSFNGMLLSYGLWREKDVPPAFALRHAQQWLRDIHKSHPKFQHPRRNARPVSDSRTLNSIELLLRIKELAIYAVLAG